MESILTDLHESVPVKELVDINSDSPKALEVHCDSSSDVLHVFIGTLSSVQLYTKKNVVSDIAKTFDVLGWFAPFTILMKIKVEWDEEVPQVVQKKYQQWKPQLPVLKTVAINRCYVLPAWKYCPQVRTAWFFRCFRGCIRGCSLSSCSIPQKIFVIGTSHSKTKVAPIKKLSIPRLELCGAHLLVKLLNKVWTSLKVNLQDTYALSGSTIVLYWLGDNSKRFKTFVGNRISTILKLLPTRCWRHAPTESNPADCASRGLMPKELMAYSLWWEGLQWLQI